MTIIAYLGPKGTWSEVAARKWDERATLFPVPAFADVVRAVEVGDADVGVLPIENSLEGAVTTTLDLLIHETELRLQAEIVIPIRHALLAKAGTALGDIRVVRSHGQALAQCRQYLQKTLPQAGTLTTASTAAAVEGAAREHGSAAIAPPYTAELYSVRVLAHDIQDVPTNATRFVVVARNDAAPTGDDKTSFAFQAAQLPRDLIAVLQAFEHNGIVITKLESRPARERLGQYIFVCDLVGHRQQPPVAKALEQAAANSAWWKLLGSYPMSNEQ